MFLQSSVDGYFGGFLVLAIGINAAMIVKGASNFSNECFFFNLSDRCLGTHHSELNAESPAA